MQKEVLTQAECRERLLDENRITPAVVGGYVLAWLFLSAITSGPITLIIWLLLSHTTKMFTAMYIILGVICALPAIIFFVVFSRSLLQSHKLYKKILSSDIEIVEDTLLRAYEDGEMRGSGRNRHYNLFYVLDFRNHGRYRLPEGQHYTWSKLYAMSDRGIYNTAISGDTFYIVRLKDDRSRQPMEVYNTKHFELCPDGTERKPRASWRDSVSLE